jgi:hypothetical protein
MRVPIRPTWQPRFRDVIASDSASSLLAFSPEVIVLPATAIHADDPNCVENLNAPLVDFTESPAG